MDSLNNPNDEIEYMGTRTQQSIMSIGSRGSYPPLRRFTPETGPADLRPFTTMSITEIKGIQLIAEPELTQDAFGRTTAVNQEVYWQQDTKNVKVGRAPQSIQSRPSAGGFRRAVTAPDAFVLSCPVMSRDHACFTLEGNQV